MSTITLITGGARSGKSRFALELCANKSAPVFVATAEVTDDEMAHRIDLHQKERGSHFTTIEAPVELGQAISTIPPQTDIVVIDCLTVWMGNLMHYLKMQERPYSQVIDFLDTLKNIKCDVVIVSNELGMGLVPPNSMGRWFRDAAGRLNQDVAKLSTQTIFMVSGYPLYVKKNQ